MRVVGAGSRVIGPTNAQEQHHRREQGHLKKPRPRSASSPTPTAAATGAGEGRDAQGGLRAEGLGATHQQAALVALHPSSVSALAGIA